MKELVKLRYHSSIKELYVDSSSKRDLMSKREVSEHFINLLTIKIQNAIKAKPHLDVKKKTIEQLVYDYTAHYARQVIGNKEKELGGQMAWEIQKLQSQYWEDHKPVATVEKEIEEMCK